MPSGQFECCPAQIWSYASETVVGEDHRIDFRKGGLQPGFDRGFLQQGGYRLFYRPAAGGPLQGKSPEALGDWWWHGADPEDVFTW